MQLKKKRGKRDASEKAAESEGFAIKCGSRMVQKWAEDWIKTRELPDSNHSHHVKAFSLLSDSTIHAEFRLYLHSNKWSMDPEKLIKFSEQKMIPEMAKQYLENIMNEEMPRSLKKYMETKLLPCLSLKVRKGICLCTACHFLQKEGF